MTKNFRKTLARLIVGLTLLLVPLSVPVMASAYSAIQNGVGCGSNLQFNTTTGCSGAYTSTAGSGVQNIIKTVINVFSLVVGIVAVIMIVVGGFKYITSGGESSKVSGAQSTILYAIVGLVVVVLAQIIVHFVLTKLSTAATSGSIFLAKFF